MPPRRVPLSAAQYDEVVSLLAELLLDVVAKRREGRSVGAMDSAFGSGMGSVVPFPQKQRKGRDAA
ncbi:MAG TPA: hypothetical protein VFW41_04795 [Gaiellaceae bacterium]|nr:hypothetical protein [Gaiellaceae bacterium]